MKVSLQELVKPAEERLRFEQESGPQHFNCLGGR